MKKLFLSLSAFIIIAFNVCAVASCAYLGDCDANGFVNINDVLLLLKKVTENSIDVNDLGDINGDSNIDITDVLDLLNVVSSQELVTVAQTSNIRLLEDGVNYIASGKQLFTFASSDSSFYIVQGGYYDGTSYHIAIIKKLSDGYEQTRIIELDSDGNKIRESEPLQLDHANNISYNSKLNCFVITHCQSPNGHYYRYSFIDPVTFETIKTEDKPFPFFAMAYSPELDKYASARWSGETLDICNGDMELIKTVNVTTPGSLSQGVFCDSKGIYFVRSSQNGYSSEIRIYDWDCNLIRTIPIALSDNIEPENISIVNGRVFVTGTNWSTLKGVAFELTFKKQ